MSRESGRCHLFDVYSLEGDHFTYSSLAREDLSSACRGDNRLSFIYGSSDEMDACKSCRDTFTTLCNIPAYFWKLYRRSSNGHMGSEDSFDSENESQVVGHTTWQRCEVKMVFDKRPAGAKNYKWVMLQFVTSTRWHRLKDDVSTETIILGIDMEDAFREQIMSSAAEMLQDYLRLYDPYWFHVSLGAEIVMMSDKAIWALRDLVRIAELSRPSPENPQANYPRIYDNARHAIHSLEAAEVIENLFGDTISQRNAFLDRLLPSLRRHLDPLAFSRLKAILSQHDSRLRCFKNMLTSLRLRSVSNSERMRNEMNLIVITVARYESKVSQLLGKAALADSAAMRTIAVVTLVFLPATLVAAIFSTGFFDFITSEGNGDQIRVNSKFWIFFAVSVPLTATTIALWTLWERFVAFVPRRWGGLLRVKTMSMADVITGTTGVDDKSLRTLSGL